VEIIYTPRAIEDLEYWRKSGNKLIQKKISTLIEAIELNPFAGIGKPEPLKHNLAGSWSRRINREHRLVYEISSENEIIILEIQSLRGHY
jgi:toxin YoeB